ncbi:MAG: hypothetical protein HC819_17440 [Cyclobacteriaceae bacterium]|nr:hypothetical protein [Cyclobacteriaceae bacterium]
MDFDLENDSIASLIDAMLFAPLREPSGSTENISARLPMLPGARNELPTAQVAVGGQFGQTPEKPVTTKNSIQGDPAYQGDFWIPQMKFDDNGLSSVEFKPENKNDHFFINIQGITEAGLIGFGTFDLDLRNLAPYRNGSKNKGHKEK